MHGELRGDRLVAGYAMAGQHSLKDFLKQLKGAREGKQMIARCVMAVSFVVFNFVN